MVGWPVADGTVNTNGSHNIQMYQSAALHSTQRCLSLQVWVLRLRGVKEVSCLRSQVVRDRAGVDTQAPVI